ncbi:MAG: hypothetical protein QM520_03735 [Gammaproteobacteria bacterium]|nr:hypothetical protein [Gammaproteobacteria bacterium]
MILEVLLSVAISLSCLIALTSGYTRVLQTHTNLIELQDRSVQHYFIGQHFNRFGPLTGAVTYQLESVDNRMMVKNLDPSYAKIRSSNTHQWTPVYPRSLSPNDCQGNNNGTEYYISNLYKLSLSNGILSLVCKNSLQPSSIFQSLAENLDQLSIQYAYIHEKDQTIQWVDPKENLDLNRIVGVEICLNFTASTRLNAHSSTLTCTSQSGGQLFDSRFIWVGPLPHYQAIL